MNLGELSVRKNRVVFVLMFLVFLGGLVAYKKLGRLEDPEFTIKEALIIHRDEVGHLPLHQQTVVWAARATVHLTQQADNTFPLRLVTVD